MQTGQLITVVDAYGNHLIRTLVSWNERVVFICIPSEFNAAVEENREPLCTGFPREFVVSWKAEPGGWRKGYPVENSTQPPDPRD